MIQRCQLGGWTILAGSIGFAWSAWIVGDGNEEIVRDAVIPGGEDEPGASGYPLGFETDLAHIIAVHARDIHFHSVGAVVTTSIRNDVQPSIGIDIGLPMIALCQPSIGTPVITRHALRIFNEVGAAACLDKFNIAQNHVTIIDQMKIDFLVISGAAKGSRLPETIFECEGLPARFFAFVAGLPGGSESIVRQGMGQFEAASSTIGRFWPFSSNLVIDLVHQVAPCILQANEFAVVTQLTIVIAQDSADVVRGHQALGIRRNHQIATRSQLGCCWYHKVNPSGQAPPG